MLRVVLSWLLSDVFSCYACYHCCSCCYCLVLLLLFSTGVYCCCYCYFVLLLLWLSVGQLVVVVVITVVCGVCCLYQADGRSQDLIHARQASYRWTTRLALFLMLSSLQFLSHVIFDCLLMRWEFHNTIFDSKHGWPNLFWITGEV